MHAAFVDYIARARRDAGAMSDARLQEFPTEFPIKVMGRHDSDLRALTGHRRAPRRAPGRVQRQAPAPARDGNFLALTYIVHATSREQLDAIYRELTACKSVLMAL